MAAQYEYTKNANIPGSRNLLLRSLRLNPEARELWLEYAKLECLFLVKIMERRRILGLDEEQKQYVEETELEFHERDEIQLPLVTEEETEKQQGDVLEGPLADVKANPALNGGIPLAVWDSAISTRPEDIALAAGFYDAFAPFHTSLQFINAALDKVKAHMEDKFPGRGRTVLIQIKDHARGIALADAKFPGILRTMMTTANTIPSLTLRERRDCCVGLISYLDELLKSDVEENLRKAIEIFRGKVVKWRDFKG
jgi:U3 small nucleolar RNA-associated protein 6